MSLSAAKRTRRASLMDETSNPVGHSRSQGTISNRGPLLFRVSGIELDLRAARAEVLGIKGPNTFSN